MGRTHAEMMAALPPKTRAKVKARAKDLIEEVGGIQAVRKLAGLSQKQLAGQLGVKQPTVHRMERSADVYVSTLERFVEAAGGTMEIRITLPGHAPVKLTRFRDLSENDEAAEPKVVAA